MLASVTARNLALSACYGANHSTDWPATLDIALYLGQPSDGGVEAGGGGYAAVNVPNDATTFPAAPADGQVSFDVDFPTSTGAWDRDATWLAVRRPSDDVLLEEVELDERVHVAATGEPVSVTVTIVEPSEAA